jgi:cathepsin A (carboxypeptidase C)
MLRVATAAAFLTATVLAGPHGHLEETRVEAGAGGLCDASVTQHSGYYKVNSPGSTDKNYFYWQFDARENAADAPFILWMTGGPGCSGQLALLNENGPCTVTRTINGLETVNNTHSWTNTANVLWIDQPTGVGFSYGDAGDYDHDERGVRDDMYYFITEFMTAHPEYASNDFYVFGESYGGHYAPNVAFRIWEGNQNATANGMPHINLKGLAVGNGLTDPAIQYNYYAKMAVNNTYGVKAVSRPEVNSMVEELAKCIPLIEQCQNDTSVCSKAQAECNNGQLGPYEMSGLNPYDVREPCKVKPLCYDFTAPTDWLNLPATREALGVTSKSANWASCNMQVNQQFSSDWMKSQQYTIPPLLAADVRVLIYAGDADFICNWMGNKAWTLDLAWPGKSAFNAAEDHDWNVDGKKAGTARHAQGLTFLQVNNAGHMVPMDQPENSLSMIETFMSGKEF